MVPTENTIFSTHLSIQEMVDISQCPIELIQKTNFIQPTLEILFTTYGAGKKFYFLSLMCVYIYMIIYKPILYMYILYMYICVGITSHTFTHRWMCLRKLLFLNTTDVSMRWTMITLSHKETINWMFARSLEHLQCAGLETNRKSTFLESMLYLSEGLQITSLLL